jgi:cytosine/adenosine deaminase-related metal-dependent hydrolase
MLLPHPIDPLISPRYALAGRIVTMESSGVLDKGVIYINAGQIDAVQTADQPAPPDYENSPLIDTKGVIYPGLIELHNHLSYNVLPLWNVPQRFPNRDRWFDHPDKRKLISGPMELLSKAGYAPAIVRYVECKCLLSGVTTSQGITLASAAGIQRQYRGIVRNVEQTDDPQLPEAGTRIPDVDDAASFLKHLKTKQCYLLHLCEGAPDSAHRHFEILCLNPASSPESCTDWAITNSLAGIHVVGLLDGDFSILAERKASIVWSPLSNLLLYGQTAHVQAAKASGVLIGIGSDWSPSGSKNLLSEMKVAWLYSENNGQIFTPQEILAMATTTAAKILGWDQHLGSIAPGKRADLLVLSRKQGDPYLKLLTSSESDISLVVINGVPRYGIPRLMLPLCEETEKWRLGGSVRLLNLKQTTADTAVGTFTLPAARKLLRRGLRELPHPTHAQTVPQFRAMFEGAPETWSLVLDNDGPESDALRPLAPRTGADASDAALEAAVPLEQIVGPIELDELTVAENPRRYFERLMQEINLPEYIKQSLPSMY